MRIVTPPENPVQRVRTFLYVDQIDVKEVYRRQRVGTLLLDAAKKVAMQQGLELVILDVWKFNREAVLFFRSQGFESRIEGTAMSVE